MVHPAGTTGKILHSLDGIFESMANLIERRYNEDAHYRDPEEPPVKKVYRGEPSVIDCVPAIAIKLINARYEDAPQGAGADVETRWNVICYGSEHGLEPQQKQAIRMVEAVRHILLDNSTIPTATGEEQVFQACYRTMEISFDEYVTKNMDELIGVQIAILDFMAVFAESGY